MKPFSIVGLIAKRQNPHVPTLRTLAEVLRELGCEVLVEANPGLTDDIAGTRVTRDRLTRQAQLAIVVGGDGTLLNAGRSLALAGVPILGVNQGRLGFMVDVNPNRLRETLQAVMSGDYETEQRLILKALVSGNGKTKQREHIAVNDVVLRNQASIRMLEFETWLGDEFISAHRADGMIVCSPTGSTAYALSGGGPLIHPSLQALALVPICPHTLSDRPIIVGADRPIRLTVQGQERTHAMVTFDGQTNQLLEPGDSVTITRHAASLQLIHPPGYNYFALLRDKLHWGSGPSANPERA